MITESERNFYNLLSNFQGTQKYIQWEKDLRKQMKDYIKAKEQEELRKCG